MKAIILDLDGTICNLYGVNGWLSMLQAENAAPYLIAKPLGDYKKLNGLLAALQGYGYAVEVVSWLAKGETTKQFDSAVRIKDETTLLNALESLIIQELE